MTVLCYGDSITEGNMLPPADREAVWPTQVDQGRTAKSIPSMKAKEDGPVLRWVNSRLF